jgi:tetratricopeptide (TPR) repeat protein
MATPSTRADFLISYAMPDAPWARWLADVIEDAGFTQVSEGWQFHMTGGCVLDLDAALDRAARVIALVSRDYVRDSFCVPKWQQRLAADPASARRLLAAVSIDPAWDYERFEGTTCIHLFDHDEESARQHLLGRLRAQFAVRGQDHSLRTFRHGKCEVSGLDPSPWPRAVGSLSNLAARRDPDFVGRDSQFAALRALVATGRRGFIIEGQSGAGGEGRSAFASEYAHRYRAEYPVVWRVRAKSEGTILSDLQALARQVNAPGHDAHQAARAALAAVCWLEQRSDWLLIFDDADTPDLVRRWWPWEGGGHVLALTSKSRWPGATDVIELGPLSDAESAALLARRAPVDATEAIALAHELGNQPLALRLAAATVAERGIALSAYRHELAAHHEALLDQPDHEDRHGSRATALTLRAAFRVALQAATEAAPQAPSVLALASAFASDAIPLEWLQRARGQDHSLRTFRAGKCEVSGLDPSAPAAIAALAAHGLLTLTATTVAVHPLIRRLAHSGLTPPERRAVFEAAARAVLEAFPEHVDDPASWPAAERLVPHVESIRARATGAALASPSQALLLSRAGAYAVQRYRTDAAHSLCARAHAIALRAVGPEHPVTATCARAHTYVTIQGGPQASAAPHAAMSLALTEKVQGPAHPDTARAAHLYAYAASRELGAAAGLQHHERAVAICEKAHPPGALPTARARLNLANLTWQNHANADKARPLYEQALPVFQSTLGPAARESQITLIRLADVCEAQGDTASAQVHLAAALAAAQTANDPLIAAALHSRLADTLNQIGAPTEAIPHLEAALAIHDRLLGPLHGETTDTLESLATLQESQSNPLAARPHRERLLATIQARFGHDDPITIPHLEALAANLASTGDHAVARELRDQARNIAAAFDTA